MQRKCSIFIPVFLAALCSVGDIGSQAASKPSADTASAPNIQSEEFNSLAEPLERAVKDLSAEYGERYPKGSDHVARLTEIRQAEQALQSEQDVEKQQVERNILFGELKKLQAEALLDNPLIDFEKIIVVRRTARNLGLPQNYESNSSLGRSGYNNDIALLSIKQPDSELTTLYRPENDLFVGDIDLHFDGDRMIFSMPGNNNRWQVHEIDVHGDYIRELPLIIEPDVDNYDACYLPDGNIAFTSTAPFVGVPCVQGASHVANIYLLDVNAGHIRRLTFDQDHDWCPTVLNNGRILFLRWEYSDIPHFASRILFHMNPDGTNQAEYYGSNSYWPNAIFYARPVPGHPSMVAGIVTGHHGVRRAGELVLFDPAKGRFEADGVVQRIPGYGKTVEPIILDELVNRSWPKFLHPFPLSSKYFLAAAQPTARSLWGIYLVDVFDNMLLLKEEEGYALLEPVPLRSSPTPPAVPSQVNLARRDGTVYLTDIYEGPGLNDVPRGTVRNLRLFTYHFAYHGMGGQINRIGMDGPWDIKRVIGTVPVESDGSAFFKLPANTPVSVQPLDEEGKAIQLMRSWMTAMPGENVSCIGCHESQNTVPPPKATLASRRAPSEIKPWYGPVRGFSFVREVQPVLDKYCVGCHDGRSTHEEMPIPDFTDRPPVNPPGARGGYYTGTKFTPSYIALKPFVRTPTIEGDLHLNPPYEWHADTTTLFRMLNKGHHGVELDPEAWDRVITWFDLNAPAHGTWEEVVGPGPVARQLERRMAMQKLYAGIESNPEEKISTATAATTPVMPKSESGAVKTEPVSVNGWPFDARTAKEKQAAALKSRQQDHLSLELGEGSKLEMVLIPEGEFVMGNDTGFPDERPRTRVSIGKPFWMGRLEVSNRQYAMFDPGHDSRIEHGDFLQFGDAQRGDKLNLPGQPALRVSWREAMAFCRWLSEKSGMNISLPTEAQWEWACRAGTASPMWYGSLDTDFSSYANLADISLKKVPSISWRVPSSAIPEWRPSVGTVNDGSRVTATAEHSIANYGPNPWNLLNMHGNVAEWTVSAYRPYPYVDDDGRNSPGPGEKRVARGGSWYERPGQATSSYRLPYYDYQKVYNVGFRIVAEPAG